MIYAMFNRKGAYARYKDLLEDRDMLEKWYEYESEKQEPALRGWCESNSIEINGQQAVVDVRVEAQT
jgi:hypothetical protein